VSVMGRRIFHQLTVRNGYRRDYDHYDESSTRKWLDRFGDRLDFTGKTVLDVGCGSGRLAVEVARLGAAHVTGIDVDDTAATQQMVLGRFPDVAERITFVSTSGDLSELGDAEFDLVISKDSMEHYPDPERFVPLMAAHLAPAGQLAIGFGPLWKSPYGAHIEYMTPLPWVHLFFSEGTILAERKRFRPHENPSHWSEIRGGLNQMTYKRFVEIMSASELDPAWMSTNVSDSRAVKILARMRAVPPLREYCTVSVYGIWQRVRL
jgi:SAM-dependent methyltransferase